MTLPPLLGRGFTVDRGRGPEQPPTPGLEPLLGLLSTAWVLAGLVLVVVGVWTAAGWSWGLAALGIALLAIERWPDGKRDP